MASREDFINIDLDHDEETNGFKLPCATLAVSNVFDAKLKGDTEYRKRIVSFIFIFII